MKYSITLASFRNIEPLEETLSKLARSGLDAVEMYGEPGAVRVTKLRDVLQSFRIPVCGVTGMWGNVSKDGWKRKLLSSDRALIRASKNYVQDCVRMYAELGGGVMNVCLFADDLRKFDGTHCVPTEQEKERMARRAAPILSELCRFAADNGVELVLEPLNRYSTPFCATARDALKVVRLVKSDSLGILLDTFHMNIEEDSFKAAVQSAGRLLGHTHFADNNRKLPGFGHVDFHTIVKSLRKIGYAKYVSFEPNMFNGNYSNNLKRSLKFMRKLAT
jgi:sugar phosphate isomerase/epimerase